MNQIEWRDEFSIGIEAVDYEHRELINLINQALLHIDVENNRDRVLGYLGDIYTMISSHFALEEKIMQEHIYDQYLDHKADHDMLLDMMRDLMDEYEDEQNIDSGEFAGKLSEWFQGHFMSKDARMHKALHM